MRFITLLLVVSAQAATVRDSATGLAASSTACAITRPAARVDAGAEQVFFRFVARGLAPGDRLRIEWVDPRGQVNSVADYTELPAARELCFLSALPVGGFAPSTQPGAWRARVVVNDAPIHERGFEITGAASSLAARVVEARETELTIDAYGATSETSVNIARYSPSGGWRYIAAALPEAAEGTRLKVRTPKLQPAEYLVVLRNPDGTQSLPARFVVSTAGGYRPPTAAGEQWRVSQRPYGSYSHWGRTIHAYDFAPVGGHYVAAMRGGTVLAHDLGLGQTPYQRTFGNYITIRHDDGEYSHYAHLRTGTFRVATGQHVEAGQVLAEVGNSGYSFGRHVHVQVTRSESIAAQSVPFQFDDRPRAEVAASPAPRQAPHGSRWAGNAAFAEWWTHLLSVPRGARKLSVKLGWEERGNDFELYVVSPSGQTYKPEGEAVEVSRPEAGPWRVSVQAVREGGAFWVEPQVTPARQ